MQTLVISLIRLGVVQTEARHRLSRSSSHDPVPLGPATSIRMKPAASATAAPAVVRAWHVRITRSGRRVDWGLDGRLRCRALRPGSSSAPAAVGVADSAARVVGALDAGGWWDVVVHAVPGVAALEAAGLHADVLLALVLLLLEHELVLRVEGRARGGGAVHRRAGAWALHAWISSSSLHVAGLHVSHVALHVAHLLLHHRRVHAACCHHLLHLHGGHGVHASAVGIRHHLRLLEHGLHHLPVSRRLRHAHRVALLILAVLVLLVLVVEVVAAVLTSEFAVSSSSIAVAKIATRLRTLDFHPLAFDFQVLRERAIDSSVAIECDEPKPARATCLLVHHQRRVKHTTELLEELPELGIGAFLRHAAHEDLRRSLLLVAWDGALRVNLQTY